MAMFHIFRKKRPELINDLNVYVPVDGEVRSITQSSDSVFASKAMGDGFIVLPAQNMIRSPVADEVIMIADTKHAIGLKMKNGSEVLIHMGVDTVDLKGEPFDIRVKTGDILEGGQMLGTMNVPLIKEYGLPTDVIVVFTNGIVDERNFVIKTGFKTAGEVITTLQVKKEHI